MKALSIDVTFVTKCLPFFHKKELHSTGCIIYKCKYCGHVSNSARNMRKHKSCNHGKSEKDFYCDICDTVFLYTAKRKHKVEFSYDKCDVCDYETKLKDKMKYHQGSMHRFENAIFKKNLLLI